MKDEQKTTGGKHWTVVGWNSGSVAIETSWNSALWLDKEDLLEMLEAINSEQGGVS